MPLSSPAGSLVAISKSPVSSPARPIGRDAGQWCGKAVGFEAVVFWLATTEVDAGERIRKCVVEVTVDSVTVTADDV